MKTLDKGNIEDIIALTPMQEGMLFHYLKEPENDHYFEQLSLKISGRVDIDYFEGAWNFVIETNEMLRTLFRWEKLKSPTQIVLKSHTIILRYHDFSSEGIGGKKERIEEIKVKDREEAFDLREVPFRVTLCKIEEDKYEMIISNHHILYDGWSTGIILREFAAAYTDLLNKKNSVRPLKTKFKEFIRRNRELDRKDREETFWKDYLKGFDTPAEFSIKRKTGKEKEKTISRSENYQIRVDKETRDKLERYVKTYKITEAALLYSGWGILLQKYNNNDDVMFGTTVSGRRVPIKGIEDMVGLFINTLPLRVRKNHSREKTLDFLYRINQTLQVREDYESSSLVNIKEYSDIGSHEELFDTVLVIENYPLDPRLKHENAPLSFDSYSIFERTHYDLTVGITLAASADDDMMFNVYYREELFEKNAIERLSHHYISVIKKIIENPGKAIAGIEIISPGEKRQILVDFNTTDADYPQDKTIHQLFEEQAARTGDNIAVVSMEHGVRSTEGRAGIGTTSITYRELKKKSIQLAHLLREKGVKPDGIVAIMKERSLGMVIGILGILKAGGAYLPIDPLYPKERKKYILKDSNARILVSEVSGVSEGIEVIDPNPLTPYHSPTQLSDYHPTHRSLAYVIYTSGSTGQPKGVTIEHGSVVNLLWQLNEWYPFKESDVYLLKTSYLFDVSVTELFGWFLEGGRLVILGKNDEKDPQKIMDAIDHSGITHINFVPSQFNVFVDWLNPENMGKISSLKYIFLAGEALLPELVHKFNVLNRRIPIENLYGPTEATVYASGYSLSQWGGASIVPIGKPLQNVKLYILDKDDHLQGVGIPGELCIMGVGVARGYLNNPELTVEKFDRDFQDYCDYQDEKGLKRRKGKYSFTSLSLYPSTSLYRTGDLARWLPDGNIEFLGRIDQQVKIRGFRIELGEIENQLLNHDEVKEAVVIAKPDETGDHFLCAYIVPVSPGLFETHHLRDHLLEKLPDYMVPAHFAALSEMPLTATGKIDRKSLPAPEATSTSEYIAPRNGSEELLVEIFTQVLGIERDRIGIDDHFFELGGHSLKIAGLIGRIHKAFNVEIPFSVLFKNPTIRGIYQYMREAEEQVYQIIPLVEEKEYYPLAPTQKRFYVFHQLNPGDISYNMYETILLEGQLYRGKFEATFRRLLGRHEILRTSFHLVEGEPVQRILQGVEFCIEYYDLEGVNGEGKEAIIRNFVRPFDLGQPPLWRVGLIKTTQDKHLFMFDMHHIISDGTSIALFIRDFLSIYKEKHLPPLKVRYRDYVRWEESKKRERGGGMSGVIPGRGELEEEVLNLPTDYMRPAVPNYEGESIVFNVGIEVTRALYGLSEKQDVTLYMLLLAVCNILFSKLSGQANIAIGSPIAGRVHVDLDNVMGMFLHIVCLRNKPAGDKRFSEFLMEVKENAVDAFENQDYQYDELVEKVVSIGNTGRDPLFDVMFVLQNMEMPEIEIPGLKVTRDVSENRSSKFDMTLFCEEKETLVFKLEYRTRLFKKKTIRRFIRYFRKVVSDILNNSDIKIWEIEIISEREKRQVLVEFNDTRAEYPRDKVIHGLFEGQVERGGDKIAAISMEHGERNKEGRVGIGPTSITYGQLNENSNQLAGWLSEKGVKSNSIVGIMVERSIEMIIGIFGILKAGGAYLPIDPKYPEERIHYMLQDSHAEIFLTTRPLSKEIAVERELIYLEDYKKTTVNKESSRQVPLYRDPAGDTVFHASQPGSSSLAYVIYTSGSTGKPKGVMIQHGSLVNRLHWMQRAYSIGTEDVILQKTTFTFDVSVWELFWWSIQGASLCLLGPGDEKSPEAITEAIERHKVTTIHFVPSMFNAFLHHLEAGNEDFSNMVIKKLASLRQVFASGEALGINQVKRFNQLLYAKNGTRLVNLYGPTEATIDVSFFNCSGEEHHERIPIGKPIDNIQLIIVDNWLKLQSVGVAGELCIAGVGLARGYLNKPELTAEKFNQDFLDYYDEQEKSEGTHHSALYRTGDLARWLPDGNIEFLRRIDHQIKIRGFRVELGEIESQLLALDEIKEAVVIAADRNRYGVKEEENGDQYLCAYIVPREFNPNEAINLSSLRNALSNHLPDYMIPTYIVPLERIPLTPNGKVNRKALPEPELKAGETYVAPRDEIEEKITEIWARVLGIDKNVIGIDDNFFKLGGHSLKATLIVSRIHQAFNVKVPLGEIFKKSAIRALSRYIKGGMEEKYTSIEAAEKKEYYELSSAQKRLYILEQMGLENTAYNMPLVFMLEGVLEKAKFEETFRKLIQRQESFRTSFHMIASEPVQKIHQEVEFTVEYYGVGEGNSDHADTPQPLKEERIIQNFIRPFDLSQAPLLRVGLIKTGQCPSEAAVGETYTLLMDMHHIISDGSSMDIFVREFMSLYGFEEFVPLRIQYKDFSRWQNWRKETESIKQQEAYWLEEFAEEIPILNLPADFARPVIQRFEGSTLMFEIGQEETGKLKNLALTEESTLFMVLLAIFNVFLAKISGQEEIVVGSPTAGRRHTDLEQIMGIFLNILALRNYPTAEKTVEAFLGEIKDNTLKAQENQEYPFEDLVEKAAVSRDTSRNPLFDVMFVLQNMDFMEIEIPGLRLKPYGYENQTSKFDLTFYCEEKGDDLLFTVEYSTKLFRTETIKRFIGYFKKVVSDILSNSGVKIWEIEVLSEGEKRQVLYAFNNTRAEYPRDKVIHALFEEEVEKNPDRIALVGMVLEREAHPRDLQSINIKERIEGEGHGEPIMARAQKTALTYKELNRTSDQLAHLLRSRGIKPGSIVCIMVERTIQMIIGILGILKAGGAYLPIDPDYPKDRIDFMLEDSDTEILLSQRGLIGENKGEGYRFGGEIVDLSDERLFSGDKRKLETINFPRDLAYLIYTSGSTGKPKGILIEHRNVVNFIKGMTEKIAFKTGKTILALTTISFDIFVLETLLPLTKGLKLVIANEQQQLDVEFLREVIEDTQVDILQVTPSRLKLLLDNFDCLKGVKEVVVGGEAFPGTLFKRLKGEFDGKIYNVYGPTETTVWSTLKDLTGSGEDEITIGTPISNTQVYILNRCNTTQPIGVAGELCIGGDGVARGYLGNPTMTANKFISNPYIKGERLYRTGDLCSWLPNGDIEFLGRIDFQVKVRGFRIELGEIESQLLNHEGIKEVVVVIGNDQSGDNYICAYLVTNQKSALSIVELREYLSRRLPDYMIPSYFVELENIPLTPNGKIDRKALPAPEVKREAQYTAPRNNIEKKLVEMWSQLLGSPDSPTGNPVIGIDDNFFQLGGHSLKAANLIAKIHKAFNVKVTLAEIFIKSTIRELSRYIEAEEKAEYISIEAAEKKEYYPLSSAQKRLYLLHQLDLESTAYNLPTAVILDFALEKDRLEDTFRKLIHRHESLRTSFHMIGDNPVQKIHKKVNFKIEDYIPGGAGGLAPLSVRVPDVTQVIKNFIRPFDVSQAPLLRVGLIKEEEQKYILMIDMYHTISDGISMIVIEREFMELYNGGTLPSLRIQYKDFSEWQNQLFESGEIKKQEEYWLKQFEKKSPVLNLPIDYPRSGIQSAEGDSIRFELNPEDSDLLKGLASKEEATLYIVLLAIFNVFLSKICRQDDIVVGSATAGRKHADLDQIIGLFVNILPMRNYPTGEKTFIAFLREVKESTIKALENQDYRFEELVAKVAGKRDFGRHPIYDVDFTFQNIQQRPIDMPEPLFISEIIRSHIDLNLMGWETRQSIAFHLQYCKKRYKQKTIEGFISSFKAIISDVIKNPWKKIEEIDTIPEEEKNKVHSRIQQTKESLVVDFDI